jgi:hypothetical protein
MANSKAHRPSSLKPMLVRTHRSDAQGGKRRVRTKLHCFRECTNMLTFTSTVSTTITAWADAPPATRLHGFTGRGSLCPLGSCSFRASHFFRHCGS